MVEVLHSDYVELAKAKGLSRWQVAFRHGLRNSLIPLITLLGPLAVGLMTGSLVVENILPSPNWGTVCKINYDKRLSNNYGSNYFVFNNVSCCNSDC